MTPAISLEEIRKFRPCQLEFHPIVQALQASGVGPTTPITVAMAHEIGIELTHVQWVLTKICLPRTNPAVQRRVLGWQLELVRVAIFHVPDPKFRDFLLATWDELALVHAGRAELRPIFPTYQGEIVGQYNWMGWNLVREMERYLRQGGPTAYGPALNSRALTLRDVDSPEAWHLHIESQYRRLCDWFSDTCPTLIKE